MKYVIVISKIIRLCSLSFFNGKGQLLDYNVVVCILVQSEEGYSLIWNAKLLTNQTGKGKYKKIEKKVKNDKALDDFDVRYHQFYIINISASL